MHDERTVCRIQAAADGSNGEALMSPEERKKRAEAAAVAEQIVEVSGTAFSALWSGASKAAEALVTAREAAAAKAEEVEAQRAKQAAAAKAARVTAARATLEAALETNAVGALQNALAQVSFALR
jgi:hypothetical protein